MKIYLGVRRIEGFDGFEVSTAIDEWSDEAGDMTLENMRADPNVRVIAVEIPDDALRRAWEDTKVTGKIKEGGTS